MKFFVGLIASSALITSALVAEDLENWTWTAASGVPTDVLVWTAWDEDCSSMSLEAHLTQEPKNGKVDQVEEVVVIGDQENEELVHGSFSKCRGNEASATIFRYESKMGFIGTDDFRARIEYEDGTIFDQPVTVIVE